MPCLFDEQYQRVGSGFALLVTLCFSVSHASASDNNSHLPRREFLRRTAVAAVSILLSQSGRAQSDSSPYELARLRDDGVRSKRLETMPDGTGLSELLRAATGLVTRKDSTGGHRVETPGNWDLLSEGDVITALTIYGRSPRTIADVRAETATALRQHRINATQAGRRSFRLDRLSEASGEQGTIYSMSSGQPEHVDLTGEPRFAGVVVHPRVEDILSIHLADGRVLEALHDDIPRNLLATVGSPVVFKDDADRVWFVGGDGLGHLERRLLASEAHDVLDYDRR